MARGTLWRKLLLLCSVAGTAAHDPRMRHFHRGKLPPYEIGPPSILLSHGDEQRLLAGEALMQAIVQEDGVARRLIMVKDVRAPPSVITRKILDIDAYPAMVKGVDSTATYSMSEDASTGLRTIKTRYDISALHVKFTYYLEHIYSPADRCMTFRLDYDRRSDLDDTVGYWYVQPRGPEECRVYYSCVTQLRGWVPGPVYSLITKAALKQTTSWLDVEAVRAWTAEKSRMEKASGLEKLRQQMRQRLLEQQERLRGRTGELRWPPRAPLELPSWLSPQAPRAPPHDEGATPLGPLGRPLGRPLAPPPDEGATPNGPDGRPKGPNGPGAAPHGPHGQGASPHGPRGAAFNGPGDELMPPSEAEMEAPRPPQAAPELAPATALAGQPPQPSARSSLVRGWNLRDSVRDHIRDLRAHSSRRWRPATAPITALDSPEGAPPTAPTDAADETPNGPPPLPPPPAEPPQPQRLSKPDWRLRVPRVFRGRTPEEGEDAPKRKEEGEDVPLPKRKGVMGKRHQQPSRRRDGRDDWVGGWEEVRVASHTRRDGRDAWGGGGEGVRVASHTRSSSSSSGSHGCGRRDGHSFRKGQPACIRAPATLPKPWPPLSPLGCGAKRAAAASPADRHQGG